MVTTLGQDVYAYDIVEDWAKLPTGWSFKEVAAVAVDPQDRVYVFNRGEHPMMVFDRDGNFLTSWRDDLFVHAHGITMSPDGTIFCTDDGDHTVKQFTTEGELLLTIGVPGKPAPFMSGEPFHRCTHVAVDPNDGNLYVSDGYGNARIHKYSPDGRHLFSWGEPGIGRGQFNIPHNLCTDDDGLLYVADRESHRIQIFDAQGTYRDEWHGVHRPSALCREPKLERWYVGELGPGMPVNEKFPNFGPRITILDLQGNVLARLGDLHGGEGPGQFLAPHGLAIDSSGDLYVGEVSWIVFGSQQDPPREVRSLRKLVKKG
jgi:DNA-binding beta-propeller fold protein YncE